MLFQFVKSVTLFGAAALFVLGMPPRDALADEAKEGRALCTATCANCHGQISEVEAFFDWRALTDKR